MVLFVLLFSFLAKHGVKEEIHNCDAKKMTPETRKGKTARQKCCFLQVEKLQEVEQREVIVGATVGVAPPMISPPPSQAHTSQLMCSRPTSPTQSPRYVFYEMCFYHSKRYKLTNQRAFGAVLSRAYDFME